MNQYFITKIVLVLCFAVALSTLSAAAKEDEIDHKDHDVASPTLIIDDITCIGNETTQCSFISKKYYQKIGDVLDPDEIIDAKLRLGTLIQFKHIDVYLKKGHQRGHVVVVFDIKEASNLQYEMVYQHQYRKTNDTFYNCDKEYAPKYNQGRKDLCERTVNNITDVNNQLYANIKNFNFLGSGKELTFEIVQTKTDNQSENFIYAPAEPKHIDNWSSRDIRRTQYVNIQYYDPHFFNSPYFYFHAYLDLTRLTNTSYSADINGEYIEPATSENDARTWFSFGRRFARHSFFSVNMSGNLTEKINQSYRLNYGFNSENDFLLPTKGSKFLLSKSIFDNANRYAIYYIKHFNLTNQSAISLGSKGSYYKQLTDDYFVKNIDLALTVKYSNLRPLNQMQGEYAGWYIGIEAFNRKTQYSSTLDKNNHITELNAGYIYQTENMVYRFTLEVSLNETK
ncbi:hypothetical protein [Thalassotalea ganghwensis]